MVEPFSGSLLDALQPMVQGDLYGFYRRLRAHDPVFWDERIPGWVVTAYHDVRSAVVDTRLSSVRYEDLDALPEDLRVIAQVFARQMLYQDDPDHGRVRGVIQRIFTPRAVESFRDQVNDIVKEMIDATDGRVEIDLVADLAYPLPMAVLCAMLGIDPVNRNRMKRFSERIGAVLGSADPSRSAILVGRRSIDALSTDMSELLDSASESQSAVVASFRRAIRDQVVSEQEALANLVLFVVAGHSTTTHLIANSMMTLLNHPKQLQRLRNDSSLIGVAIEELLRFDSPVQVMIRKAVTPFEIGDKSIAAGETVLLIAGAANRDPAVFVRPDQLDFDRGGERHMAFGLGQHHCLGAALARLQAEAAISALIQSFPDMTLLEQELEWIPSISFRGPKRLLVEVSGPSSRGRTTATLNSFQGHPVTLTGYHNPQGD